MTSIHPVHVNLIVPCYNEEAVLPETSRQLLAMLGKLQAQGRIDMESSVTFVDDGSRDRTWQMIEELSRKDPRVHGIKLSRNQGHQNALLAGLLSARGDVLVSLDADLQDDIEAIPRMLDEYERGADIVYGVRARRDTDTMFKRWTARAYYGLLRKFGVDIVPDHADFRLMSRRSLDALRDFREVNLFLRGIIPMLGFRTAIVTYDRLSRFAGESKYPVLKMLALALNGIFSFSTVPLQWITVFGFVLSAASMAIGMWALFIRFATNLAIPGWASTVIPMYFLGGLQLLALGIIGGYLSRIYSETKQRPRFIIEKSI
ncbi:MAG TPA: glycosyltransferase family 2 protein [Noviherbaspirillum sp.]|jgi:glycosyltransferase involved in cell wall biosynthesis|uniref:glycosyltransferase family 2 protein n=1 Tax=Noviherbaspirillum sp. TaxID=1926288 RepID=UPI002DDD5EBF|nr:glycosyltransferase family 2 protein [Noviherbaspirillum sp.]HEV2613025.1 glycosyltransferase family 2 protein [Noviherbaspirillum sp.]